MTLEKSIVKLCEEFGFSFFVFDIQNEQKYIINKDDFYLVLRTGYVEYNYDKLRSKVEMHKKLYDKLRKRHENFLYFGEL